MPGAVFTGVADTAGCAETILGAGAAVFAPVAGGAEFNGAPTAISQRCPGCPCAGFNPPVAGTAEEMVVGAVVLDCKAGAVVIGVVFNGDAFIDCMPESGKATVDDAGETGWEVTMLLS